MTVGGAAYRAKQTVVGFSRFVFRLGESILSNVPTRGENCLMPCDRWYTVQRIHSAR